MNLIGIYLARMITIKVFENSLSASILVSGGNAHHWPVVWS